MKFLLPLLAAPLLASSALIPRDALAQSTPTANAPLPPEIENEQALAQGTQPWHATLMPYANLQEALRANRYESSFARSLNGEWKFNWVKRPEQRPVDFYKPEFDVSAWKNIAVPSNWQIKGYGTPYYRNNGYTFARDWPRVMTEPPRNWTAYDERNPVGSYRRNFEVPAQWDNRRVLLSFDGVDSAFYVWVNGQKVGYSTNSRNVAEFDITKYLRRGATNTLAVEVYTYSSGSYLEDQDMWRLSGIFRNVTLWSAPQLHMRDFALTTDLDAQYRNATLGATVKVRNASDSASSASTCEVTLYDRAGKIVPGVRAVAQVPAMAAGQEAEVKLSVAVANPAKWNAETPNLYTAVLALRNGADAPELISQRVGFRKVEIKGRLFCVNGVPVKLKGANRHENWPDSGHYVSDARMIQDIVRLKEANCNHVRTCHYSDDPRWYELCDEYGLYLVAEANVESHGYYGVLDREPRYEKAIVDRNVANVENFKNHASIVIWSLGNECGGGSNFRSALAAIKAIDTSRPTHYEPFGIGNNNPADIDSQMYTSPDGTERNGQSTSLSKPFYLCEYAHAMFNSMGSLGDYNDIFDKYPALMGGAIWEWEDQGLWNARDPKRQYMAYGGGFGEIPNDQYFIHKGVVFSDRTPKPHFPEVQRAYQWVGFAPENLAAGRVKIKNKFAFTNLSKYAASWTLTEDGVRIQGGALPALNLAPGAEQVLALPLKRFAARAGAMYLLNMAVSLAKPEPWAKAGYTIARAQFPMPSAPSATVASAAKPVQVADEAGRVTVSGDGFRVAFDKSTGTLSEISRGGANVLLPGGGPKLHLWRAEHRNDDSYASRQWNEAGLRDLKPQVLEVTSQRLSAGAVRVSSAIQYTGKGGFSVTHTAGYTIYGDGTVAVDNALVSQGRRITLARVGVRMMLDKKLGAVDYLARGPMENYSDRKRGSDIGLYSSSVGGLMTQYSKPMENGNHEDAHWLALKGAGMPTFVAQAENAPLQFSALPYSDEQMEDAEYLVDLPASSATVLCLAAKTLGVGSASCGPRPLPQYLVDSSPTAFSYVLRLLAPNAANVAQVARTLPPQNRARPVLAERDNNGLVTLSSLSPGIEYSMDGASWHPYSAPFEMMREGTLRVRSAAGGQVFESSLPFEKFVDRRKWKVTASDFEASEGNPANAIDGSDATFWHSQYSPNKVASPHTLTVDLGEVQNITGLALTPRQDMENGRIRDYEIYLSADGQDWGQAVFKGRFPNSTAQQKLTLPGAQQTRFVKLVVKSEHSNQDLAALSNINVLLAE